MLVCLESLSGIILYFLGDFSSDTFLLAEISRMVPQWTWATLSVTESEN